MNQKEKNLSKTKPCLLSISNEDCVLISFINEESFLQVGFLAWIANKDDIQNVDSIIKNEKCISMFWPDGIDVKPCSSAFIKKLHLCSFDKHTVQVLACGTWVEMNEKLKTMEKIGETETSKSTRKNFTKKRFASDSECVEEEKDVIKRPRILKVTKNLTNDFDDLENIEPQVKINFTNYKENKEKERSSDEESDIVGDEVELLNMNLEIKEAEVANLKQELEKEILKNQNLTKENRILKKLEIEQNETIIQLQSEIENLERKSEQSQLKLNEPSTINKDIAEIHRLSEKILKCISNNVSISSTSGNSKKINVPPKNREEQQIKEQEQSPNDEINDDVDVENVFDNSESGSINENNKEQKIVKSEEFVITTKHLQKVRTSTASDMTDDLLEKLFTEDELANSSASGRKVNARLDILIKPPLDPARVTAIKGTVMKKFGRTMEVKKIINSRIRAKVQKYGRESKKN